MRKNADKISNKALIQSFKLTSARYNVGIYGQRLILRIVENLQSQGYVEGVDFAGGVNLIDPDKTDNELDDYLRSVEFKIPLKDLMTSSAEYSQAKSGVRRLMQQIIEYESEDGSWTAFPFLTYAHFEKGTGIATVTISRILYRALLDFTKGFRRYELSVALSLKLPYSIRLYQLVCGQQNPLTFEINEFKKMIAGMKNERKVRYPRIWDFAKRVLEPAKQELDSCSPYTFTYKFNKTPGKVGHPTITSVTLYPVYQLKYDDVSLHPAARSVEFSSLSYTAVQTLMQKYGFTKKMIGNNLPLFETAEENIDLVRWLDDMSASISKVSPKNVQGYIVGALRWYLDALDLADSPR